MSISKFKTAPLVYAPSVFSTRPFGALEGELPLFTLLPRRDLLGNPYTEWQSTLRYPARSYVACGCSVRGLMRAVRAATPAKAQKVGGSPAAPATTPALRDPRAR